MPPHDIRHFLRDDDLTPTEQAEVLALAAEMKASPYDVKPLAGQGTVGIIFDKPTLRTQATFVAGITELGGNPMVVDGNLAKIGVRESIADVVRVLGRQTSMIVWRTGDQSRLDEMAAYAGVPVVNALTDQFHPCQLLADLQTIAELKGTLAALRLTYLGDSACNMPHSFLLAGTTAGLHVTVSGPDGFAPDRQVLSRAQQIARETGGSAQYVQDAVAATTDADVVVTDTCVSMGKDGESTDRAEVFRAWQLNADLLAHARPDAIVLHCLPAYRGREITADVIAGPQSVVWGDAENRRRAQKALLARLAEGGRAASASERVETRRNGTST